MSTLYKIRKLAETFTVTATQFRENELKCLVERFLLVEQLALVKSHYFSHSECKTVKTGEISNTQKKVDWDFNINPPTESSIFNQTKYITSDFILDLDTFRSLQNHISMWCFLLIKKQDLFCVYVLLNFWQELCLRGYPRGHLTMASYVIYYIYVN